MESASSVEKLAEDIQERLQIGVAGMAGNNTITGGGEPNLLVPPSTIEDSDNDRGVQTGRPKRFNGDPAYLREFLVQCRITFRASKKYRGTGKNKLRILYACSRFTGAPSH